MPEFVELQGATGATYRFRLWAVGAAHLPIAGNYAVVRHAPDGFSVVTTDVSDNLSTVRQNLERTVAEQPGIQIYTRLNVSRAVRVAENEDIVAATTSIRTPPPAAGSMAPADSPET